MEVDLSHKPEELWENNPYGKVPVLVDGDAVVYESAIINEYLEEKYPEVPLFPKDPFLRARARIWIDFCNTRLQQAASDFRHKKEPERVKKNLDEYLLILDREMTRRTYIAGEYSLGDITYAPFFVRQERYGVSIGADLPHVKAWMDRVLDRPAVRATL